MARRGGLERLLRLRELEEERSRIELEASVGDRDRLAQEHAEAKKRRAERRGSFAASIGEEDSAARMGAAMGMEQARRQEMRLVPELKKGEAEIERRREDFLARRMGRRQVESLMEAQRQRMREETGRRTQQMLDDWHGRRRRGPGGK